MFFHSIEHKIGGILGCDKETGDNFRMHELGQHDLWLDLLVQITAAQVETDRDVCILGALCSHICIPTPSGYARCLCPTGYKLREDGWTCGEQSQSLCLVLFPPA